MLSLDIVISNLRTLGALELAQRTAREHRITLNALLTRDRSRSASAARRRFWSLLRWSLDLPYAEIGRALGFDHTTIHSGVRKRERELARQSGPGIVVVTRNEVRPNQEAVA